MRGNSRRGLGRNTLEIRICGGVEVQSERIRTRIRNSRKIRPDWIIQETVETGQKEKEAVEESVKL
jgi:hypothetical protein